MLCVDGKPVIWYLEFGASDFQFFVWTLVDSDEAGEGVPHRFVTHETRHFVIYSTSPSKERWSRLHKSSRLDNIQCINVAT